MNAPFSISAISSLCLGSHPNRLSILAYPALSTMSHYPLLNWPGFEVSWRVNSAEWQRKCWIGCNLSDFLHGWLLQTFDLTSLASSIEEHISMGSLSATDAIESVTQAIAWPNIIKTWIKVIQDCVNFSCPLHSAVSDPLSGELGFARVMRRGS